jgi:carbonic anhydrase
MAHTCKAVVVTCIDFRFQKFIDTKISENLGERNHDRVAWAGGVKDWDNVMNQIDISKRLHDISEVVLMNHEECGAYGEAGTPEKHSEDLKAAREEVLKKYPEMDVKLFYVHLDGTFEQV